MLKALPKTRGYILPGQALESKIIKETRTQSSQRIKTEMHAQRGEKVPKTKHYKSKHALSAVSLHKDKTAAGLINGTCLKSPIFGKYFATTTAPDKTSGPSVHGGHALLESLQSLKCFLLRLLQP